MQIVELTERYADLFCTCLQPPSPQTAEAGDRRRQWYDTMKTRGLRALLAFETGADPEEGDRPVGMIQYLPNEQTLLEGGKGGYYAYCIWVTPNDAALGGNHQGHGIGTALLEAAEKDVKRLGGNALSAWGLRVPIWMRASWFKKHGYVRVDSQGLASLMWKPFNLDARPPRFVHVQKRPQPVPGQVTVTAFVNGWCAAGNTAYERAKRAVAEIGPPAVFQEISTLDLDVAREWGMLDAIYIDGQQLHYGPPPAFRRLQRRIARECDKCERATAHA